MLATPEDIWKCNNCKKQFFLDEVIHHEESGLLCPFCNSDAIEPYEGKF